MRAAIGRLETQHGVKWPPVLWAFAGSLVLALLGLYQMRVNAEWQGLPEASSHSVAANETRLNAIDDLMERHPVWIGSLEGQQERSRLNSLLSQLKTNEAVEQSLAKGEEELAILGANSARQRAMAHLKKQEFEEARSVLIEALDNAPADWSEADQVRSDIFSIEKELEVKQ
ncbi:MAG: hypothetical protein ACI8TQ_002286 [Planctomycetota bacterium]|jgi:hypothetical protein